MLYPLKNHLRRVSAAAAGYELRPATHVTSARGRFDQPSPSKRVN